MSFTLYRVFLQEQHIIQLTMTEIREFDEIETVQALQDSLDAEILPELPEEQDIVVTVPESFETGSGTMANLTLGNVANYLQTGMYFLLCALQA